MLKSLFCFTMQTCKRCTHYPILYSSLEPTLVLPVPARHWSSIRHSFSFVLPVFLFVQFILLRPVQQRGERFDLQALFFLVVESFSSLQGVTLAQLLLPLYKRTSSLFLSLYSLRKTRLIDDECLCLPHRREHAYIYPYCTINWVDRG